MLNHRRNVLRASQLLCAALGAKVEAELQRQFPTAWQSLVSAPVDNGRPLWNPASLLDTIGQFWELLKDDLRVSQRELKQLLAQAAPGGELSGSEAAAILERISAFLAPFSPSVAEEVAALKTAPGTAHTAPQEEASEELGIEEETAPPEEVAVEPDAEPALWLFSPPAQEPPEEEPGNARASTQQKEPTARPAPSVTSDEPRLLQALSIFGRGLGRFVKESGNDIAVPDEPRTGAVVLLNLITSRWWEFQSVFASERAALVSLHQALGSSAPIPPGNVDRLLEEIETVLGCVAPHEAEEVAALRSRSAKATTSPETHFETPGDRGSEGPWGRTEAHHSRRPSRASEEPGLTQLSLNKAGCLGRLAGGLLLLGGSLLVCWLANIFAFEGRIDLPFIVLVSPLFFLIGLIRPRRRGLRYLLFVAPFLVIVLFFAWLYHEDELDELEKAGKIITMVATAQPNTGDLGHPNYWRRAEGWLNGDGLPEPLRPSLDTLTARRRMNIFFFPYPEPLVGKEEVEVMRDISPKLSLDKSRLNRPRPFSDILPAGRVGLLVSGRTMTHSPVTLNVQLASNQQRLWPEVERQLETRGRHVPGPPDHYENYSTYHLNFDAVELVSMFSGRGPERDPYAVFVLDYKDRQGKAHTVVFLYVHTAPGTVSNYQLLPPVDVNHDENLEIFASGVGAPCFAFAFDRQAIKPLWDTAKCAATMDGYVIGDTATE